MSNIDEVEQREAEAGLLSDLQIWYAVISKFVMFTDMPVEMRIDMILQTLQSEDLIAMLEELLNEYLKDDEIPNEFVQEAIDELNSRE